MQFLNAIMQINIYVFLDGRVRGFDSDRGVMLLLVSQSVD